MNFIEYENPEVYYIYNDTGGIIYYYVQHQLFNKIMFGNLSITDQATAEAFIIKTVAAKLDVVSPSQNFGSTSTAPIANIIGDLSGLVSSFNDINDINLKLASKKALTAINTEIINRINAPITDESYTINDITVYYQKNKYNRVHGFLSVPIIGYYHYIAVFFEGNIMGDSWFDTEGDMICSRCFNEDNAVSVPIGTGSTDWYKSTYNTDTSQLIIGGYYNVCDIDLEFAQPGINIKCGDFTARYIPLNQQLASSYLNVIWLDRLGIGFRVKDMNNVWTTTNNLPDYLVPYDEFRQEAVQYFRI